MAETTTTYLEAAISVLHDMRRPLTSRELIEEVLRRGLVKPSGKTPEATLSAALYRHGQSADEKRIARIAQAGSHRAVRGSVRWTLPDL